MSARPLSATRRTALAVAAGLTGLAVGGCTPDDADLPAATPSTSAPPDDADQTLVTDVVLSIGVVDVLVQAARQDLPGLRGELGPLQRMHTAHLEVLDGFDDSIPSPAPFTGGRAGARQEVMAAERQLQRELAAAAVRAESGTLAKLLASMSAAVAQHLAVLG